MFRNPTFSVTLLTTYLVVYCLLLQAESTQRVAFLMLVPSPFLLVWMVYTVLKYGKYTGRELSEDQEYGYEDRCKNCT